MGSGRHNLLARARSYIDLFLNYSGRLCKHSRRYIDHCVYNNQESEYECNDGSLNDNNLVYKHLNLDNQHLFGTLAN